ncbi:MAG: glycine--tRNA ligase subunit beta, partial [Alphaproteobacteria bacterium]
MPSLLLELFSEEIPARMQADAEQHLAEALELKLAKLGYEVPKFDFKGYSTPRRIAVFGINIPAAQDDISQEVKGPKVGAPEQALAGFLKKTGLSKEQLEERDGVYFANIHQKGRSTADVLK